jgi:hypothetical protein
MTSATRNAREVTVSKSVMEQAAAAAESAVATDSEVADLEASILAQLEAALDEASAEVAGPTNWWDLIAIGPFTSPVTAGFPKPNPIVRVGQTVQIVSVLFLNPVMPPPGPANPSPLQIYGPLGLNYRLNWDTTNVSNCTHVAALSGAGLFLLTNNIFNIQVITLVPTAPGLCELNLRGQILTAANTTYPPFAAYASRVESINSSIFGPNGLTVQFEQPIRFDVYA